MMLVVRISLALLGFFFFFRQMPVKNLFLLNPAYAKKVIKKQEDVLDTKEVKKITKAQAHRLEKIAEFKAKAAIGESEDGRLLIKEEKKLSKKEVKSLKKLVSAENKDREKLYKKIIEANKYNKEQEKILRMSMFKSRLDLDPIGTYYFQENYWHKK